MLQGLQTAVEQALLQQPDVRRAGQQGYGDNGVNRVSAGQCGNRDQVGRNCAVQPAVTLAQRAKLFR
jgi:hypothetical protein